MVKKNLAIFISGAGSNLKKIISSTVSYNFPAKVKLIVTNNPKAKGINFAKKYSIPFLFFNEKKKLEEIKLIKKIENEKIDLICLAGYMKILSGKFTKSFRNKIINIHPSLLPKFKGLNTYKRVLEKKERKTGCTVHFVNDKLDDGNIILRKFLYVDKNDKEETLRKKTKALEHKLFPEAILKIVSSKNS